MCQFFVYLNCFSFRNFKFSCQSFISFSVDRLSVLVVNSSIFSRNCWLISTNAFRRDCILLNDSSNIIFYIVSSSFSSSMHGGSSFRTLSMSLVVTLKAMSLQKNLRTSDRSLAAHQRRNRSTPLEYNDGSVRRRFYRRPALRETTSKNNSNGDRPR